MVPVARAARLFNSAARICGPDVCVVCLQMWPVCLLQAGEQFGLPGVEFGCVENISAAQFCQLVDHGENIQPGQIACGGKCTVDRARARVSRSRPLQQLAEQRDQRNEHWRQRPKLQRRVRSKQVWPETLDLEHRLEHTGTKNGSPIMRHGAFEPDQMWCI